LYALANKLQSEQKGGVVTETMFDAWRNDWLAETEQIFTNTERTPT